MVSRISVNQSNPLAIQFKYYSLNFSNLEGRSLATTDFLSKQDTMRFKSAGVGQILYRYVSHVFRVNTVRCKQPWIPLADFSSWHSIGRREYSTNCVNSICMFWKL